MDRYRMITDPSLSDLIMIVNSRTHLRLISVVQNKDDWYTAIVENEIFGR